MKYIDTHVHLTSEYFTKKEIDIKIKKAQKVGVHKMLLLGVDKNSSIEVIKTASQYEGVYPAIGIHPLDAKSKRAANFLGDIWDESVVAIGEIGLDLHYDNNQDIEMQKIVLEKQLHFALKKNIPALIHVRDANDEMFAVLSKPEFQNLKKVMHSFTGSIAWAKKYMSLGAYISISGIVTFKNAKEVQEMAKSIPLNKLLSETDTPYLAPTPKRGKQNEPAYVVHIVDYIANIRGLDISIVANAINKNVEKLFKI